MDKKINFKNVAITILAASNLFLLNEVKTIERETINTIYMEQVESGFYNEYPINEVGSLDPMNRKLEKQLNDNHKNGMY